MVAVTSIVVRGDDDGSDDDDATQAFRLAVTWFLLGLRARDERPDDSDATCERLLAWLRDDRGPR